MWLDPAGGKRGTNALTYYELSTGRHTREASAGTAQASNPADAMMLGVGNAPVVIRISPMAHFATAFLALALLVLVPAWGNWSLVLLAIPVAGSVAIQRLRTTAGPDAVTARGVVSSTTLTWNEIDGLRFTRGGWARAQRPVGGDVVLPAVTFATLPTLAQASGGKVPNPYR